MNISALNSIRTVLDQREKETLSPFAAFSSHALRRTYEIPADTGYRQPFSLDADRILHSLAYARYIDKTQVFSFSSNDHITHRILHVQLVSKIARSIGRFLGLNEDLIEAVALGHDIGHTPFGHDGESFLSEICKQAGIGYFHHSVQSIQFLEKLERKGKGWNLCLQTLDGILCHDGEVHDEKLEPAGSKTFEMLEQQITDKKADSQARLIPMTMEGCVVRMADTVSYIGRDIEDAIRMNLIRRSDLPEQSAELLGNTNGTIVYHLVTDMIQNSFQHPYIAFSPEISEALKCLKAFNFERIYLHPKVKKHSKTVRKLFAFLFEKYMEDIRQENRTSAIFTGFLDGMSAAYTETHRPEEIVRDFIAGMTDRYFLRQCPQEMQADIVEI
jgi:dGTPase